MGNINTDNFHNFCGCGGDTKNQINLHEDQIQQTCNDTETLKKAKSGKQIPSRVKELFIRFVQNVRLEKLKKIKIRVVSDIIAIIDLNICKYGDFIKNQLYLNKMPKFCFKKLLRT